MRFCVIFCIYDIWKYNFDFFKKRIVGKHVYMYMYMYMYIYKYIYIYIIQLLRNLLPFFENITASKKVEFLFRKYDCFVPQKICEKVNYLFRANVFSFENMNISKKANYLLRKNDCFFQKYDLISKPDELPWKLTPVPRKPGRALGPIYPLWARRRPGRVRMRRAFPIY